MNPTDIEYFTNKLENIYTIFGVAGLLVIVLATVTLIFSWKFLIKKTEKMAEEASEKSLKKFQSELDRDLIKFQTKHQKQIDAVHDTFQKFQKMTFTIKHIVNGGNFIEGQNPRDEVQYLIKYRHDFLDIFHQNHLLFSKDLCKKIENSFPTIDRFITTFEEGLFPEMSQEEMEYNAKENNGLILAGIWRGGTFEEIVSELDIISEELEDEFRKIYGT